MCKYYQSFISCSFNIPTRKIVYLKVTWALSERNSVIEKPKDTVRTPSTVDLLGESTQYVLPETIIERCTFMRNM